MEQNGAVECLYYSIGGVDFFLFFWIFDLLQLSLDWQTNSKTKVEKTFSFIVMSSYAEMSFLGPKKVKKSLNRVKHFFSSNRSV
jgi:hypothetical protein